MHGLWASGRVVRMDICSEQAKTFKFARGPSRIPVTSNPQSSMDYSYLQAPVLDDLFCGMYTIMELLRYFIVARPSGEDGRSSCHDISVFGGMIV